MRGSFKITNDIIFYEAAEKEALKRMKSLIPSVSNSVQPDVARVILKSLNDSPTTKSLLAGKLKHDFGLFGNVASVTVNGIVKYISDNVLIKIGASKISGSMFSLAIEIPTTDENIINTPGGSFPSKGGDVDWLEWLLTKGTQVVIGNFWLFPYAKGRTRSGGNSIMAEVKTMSRQPFRVDPNFAGTVENNFITRSIESVGEDILNVVANAFIRSF